MEGGDGKLGGFKTKGKRRQVSFRITEIAQVELARHAELFVMTPNTYAKAVLYRELGVFSEPLDQRRRTWKRKQHLQELENLDDDEDWGKHGRQTTRP